MFDYVSRTTSSSLECHVAMSLIHMINVILVLHSLPIMLILENFGENAFGARWNRRVINWSISSILDAHSSSVNCVELIFHSRASGRALSACSSRIIASLCHWGPLDFKLRWLSGYQVLRLVAARLYHQALVYCSLVWVGISTNGARIEGLPGILLVTTLDLSVWSDLHHAIDERLIELVLLIPAILCSTAWNEVLLPLRVLLRDQTHG